MMKRILVLLSFLIISISAFAQKGEYYFECSNCEKEFKGGKDVDIDFFTGITFYQENRAVAKIPADFTLGYQDGKVKIETLTSMREIDGLPTYISVPFADLVKPNYSNYSSIDELRDSLSICGLSKITDASEFQEHLSNDSDTENDNELIQSAALVGNVLTIVDAGNTFSIDLSSVGTDDQIIESFAITGNSLMLEIQDGGVAAVDLTDFISVLSANINGTYTHTSGANSIDIGYSLLMLPNGDISMLNAQGASMGQVTPSYSTVSSPDGSIIVTNSGNDYFVSVPSVSVCDSLIDCQVVQSLSIDTTGSNDTINVTNTNGSTYQLINSEELAFFSFLFQDSILLQFDKSGAEVSRDTIRVPDTNIPIVKTRVDNLCDSDLSIDGFAFKETKTNTVNTTQSVPSSETGDWVDIAFRGENDISELDVEEESVAQKVLEATEFKDCDLSVFTYVENYTTQTHVSNRFGDDLNGRTNRSDKPLQEIQVAVDSMRSRGLLTNEYSLFIHSGVYTGNAFIRADAGEVLNIRTASGVTIESPILANGGEINISGFPNIVRTNAPALRASNGGILRFEVNDIQGTGQTVVSQFDGSEVYGNFNTMNGGSIEAQNGGMITVKGNYFVSDIRNFYSVNTDIASTFRSMMNVDVNYVEYTGADTDLVTTSNFSINGNSEMHIKVNRAVSSSNNIFLTSLTDNITGAGNPNGNPMITVQSGRFESSSDISGNVGFRTNTLGTAIPQELKATSSVFVHKGSFGNSYFSHIGNANEIKFYNTISSTKPLAANTNLLHGTADVSINVD